MGLFAKIKEGLKKTRDSVVGQIDSMLKSFSKIDEELFEELEELLVMGDVGINTSQKICDQLRKKVKKEGVTNPKEVHRLLEEIVAEMLEGGQELNISTKPSIILVIGVNGVGKTTTIGKLANYYLKKGYTPVVAASDTFRAGAIEQVTHHADNVGVKIIKHQKGSDPAAVAFDAVEHAKAQGKELVLIDTAGRMQTNTNLMDEMKKIKRVVNPDLVIFVGDAITGNDATEQARKFNEAIDIDGVILTKADADSKGGSSLSIGYVIKKPIMFLGVGQGYDDIMEYDAEWMLNQIFSEDEDEIEAD